MIASVSSKSKIVVEKSTVPVKTAEAIEKVNLCDVLETCVMTQPFCFGEGLLSPRLSNGSAWMFMLCPRRF